jgi:MFS family permease
MAALLLTLFLEALDSLILSAALPTITNSLHGLDRYTWVITAYLLASTPVVPLAGKLSDQFGRKGFLIAGTAIFLLGSLLSGAAQTMDQLIFFRAIQGLGSGIGIALVFTVVGDLYPPEQRASKQGLLGIVFGVSNLVGPTLGGQITEHGPLLTGFVNETTRWRWIFYINLPIGIVALLALVRFLPSNLSEHAVRERGWAAVRRIDWLGASLIVAATSCLLFGLTLGSARTAAAQQAPGLLVAAVLYLLLLLVESKVAEPILPLRLLRIQIFAADAMLTLIQGMVLIGVGITMQLFLQGVMELSPTSAGAVMTAMSISIPIGAGLATFVVTTRKRYQSLIILGMALLTGSVFLLTRVHQETSLLLIILALALVGLSTGTFFAVQMSAAQNVLPPANLGIGTGMIRYLGQLGPTLGVALVGVVVNSALTAEGFTGLPTTVAGQMALAGALQTGLFVLLALGGAALVTSLFLKDAPMKQ